MIVGSFAKVSASTGPLADGVEVDERTDSHRALRHAAAMWSTVTPYHVRDSCLSHLSWRDLLVHATYHAARHPVMSPEHEAVTSSVRASCSFAPRRKSWTSRSRTSASLIGCSHPAQTLFTIWTSVAITDASCDFIAMSTRCEVGRRSTATSGEWRTWCLGTGKLEGTGNKWWPIEKREGIC